MFSRVPAVSFLVGLAFSQSDFVFSTFSINAGGRSLSISLTHFSSSLRTTLNSCIQRFWLMNVSGLHILSCHVTSNSFLYMATDSIIFACSPSATSLLYFFTNRSA